MRLFSTPNLSSHEVAPIDIESAPTVTRPELKDKTAYRAWCNNPKTQHSFVSFFEGQTPGVRISVSNPPRRLHGLTLEYDAKAPRVPDLSVARFLPKWKVTSFSGNMRLLFPFEAPISVDDTDLAREFQKIAHKNLKAKKLGAGWEPEESAKTNQYFEIGSEWIPIGGSPLPVEALYGWLAEAASKVRWDRKGIQIPFEKLRERGEAMFPGRWPGGWAGFAPGARGSRFWETSADAESVIVTETGCVCFTGDNAFRSWADIFGSDWVREQQGGAIGEAIANMWWEDGTSVYWRRYPSGDIGAMRTIADVKLHLRVLGLRDEMIKGKDLTPVEDAIYACQMTRRADYVVPLIYRPNDIVYHNNRAYLNTSRVRPTAPLPDPRAWGEGFPWTARYFDKLWDRVQWEYFISWAANFYQQALAGKPTTGLALFIAGDGSIGKNFTANAVLGQLLGGHADASKFVTGKDEFNGNLLAAPIWTCHDTQQTADNPTSRNAFTQRLKRIIADRELISRSMFKEGVDVPWNGRIIVTLNTDAESLRMLPDLEQTTLNKVLLLRASDPGVDEFPADEEILAELPSFGAFLRDYEIPAAIREARFGIRAWHHPDLLDAAHAESPITSALEVISIWRKEYFSGVDKGVENWVGNSTELLQEMLSLDGTRDLIRSQFRNGAVLGRNMTTLVGRGTTWLHKVPGGRRQYRIDRP